MTQATRVLGAFIGREVVMLTPREGLQEGQRAVIDRLESAKFEVPPGLRVPGLERAGFEMTIGER